MGDREHAVRACQHYLALRADPDPPLRAERQRVRAELARCRGMRVRAGERQWLLGCACKSVALRS